MATAVVEQATTKTREVEGTKSTSNGSREANRLELAWDWGTKILPTQEAPDHKKNTKLVVFLVAMSLVSLVGIVVDMGLRYGFTKPRLWEW